MLDGQTSCELNSLVKNELSQQILCSKIAIKSSEIKLSRTHYENTCVLFFSKTRRRPGAACPNTQVLSLYVKLVNQLVWHVVI